VSRRTLLRWAGWLGVLVLWGGVSWAGQPPTGEGLVGFWAFDGSIADGAGEADDLKAQGGRGTLRFVGASQVPGTVGKALALGVRAGDVGYLAAPLSADVKLGLPYTIEAWVHPTQLSAWSRLVLNWGTAPHYAYHLAIHNGAASLYHGQANGTYVCAEGGRVGAGRWHHIAGVARRNAAEPARSTLEVYLDGRRVAAAPFDGTLRTPDREGLGIGDSAGAPSPASRFRGYLDELAIWRRALDPDEIRARYAQRAAVLRDLERTRLSRSLAVRATAVAKLRRLGVDRIVVAERAPGRDPQGHYYANFGHSCADPDYWLHGRDGGGLFVLDLRAGDYRALVADPAGAVRDPQVHRDGTRILFSFRKGGTHHYNLYEIRTDGTGLRQITRGPWDDIEPAYLPDGGIVFCSTRCNRFIGCWLAQAATLHRCGPSGQNIRMLSSGAFTENTPAVLPDGRVLYTRWEYVNRDPVSFHHLWTMSPDGTGQMTYFGNARPGGVFIDAQPIPGTQDVVLIHSPGHGRNEHVGRVAIVSSQLGPNAPPAMRTVSRSGGFRDPYPLAADAFLVARGNQVLLMDARGGREVVHEAAGMVHEPRPILPRPRPHIVAPRVDLAQATGTLLLTDVTRGRHMAGVERGQIRKLLVLEELPKPANFHGGGSQPIGHGVTSTLKRILGTVPVEPDGSACFTVPALRSVYFAALDGHGRSVKQMRSFVTLQPGETTGCVGCHEPRTETTSRQGTAGLLALRRPPSRIEPIRDVPAILDFPRDVQPILDRHCLRCHNHRERKGGVTLHGDRGPVYSLSYYTLLLHWQVQDTAGHPGHGSGRQPGGDRPYGAYSGAAPLMKKIDGSHNHVQLSPREKRIVRLWIDTSAQYAGTYAAYGTGQVGGCWGANRPVRVMADAWPSTPPASDAVERRCGACHARKLLPRHVTAQIALDHGDMLSWTRPLSRFSRHRVFNLSRPEKSLMLLAPLSRAAGGYAEGEPQPRQIREDRRRPPKPIVHPAIFAATSDADYQKILAHIVAARQKLDEIKRFDMPGFRPSKHYIRELRRYGVLPANLAHDAPIDPYEADEAYWQSLWHRPAPSAAAPRAGLHPMTPPAPAGRQ